MSAPRQPATAEHARLAAADGRLEDGLLGANPWYEWGPYLPSFYDSERAGLSTQRDCGMGRQV